MMVAFGKKTQKYPETNLRNFRVEETQHRESTSEGDLKQAKS
jgi:hypothetical protein